MLRVSLSAPCGTSLLKVRQRERDAHSCSENVSMACLVVAPPLLTPMRGGRRPGGNLIADGRTSHPPRTWALAVSEHKALPQRNEESALSFVTPLLPGCLLCTCEFRLCVAPFAACHRDHNAART